MGTSIGRCSTLGNERLSFEFRFQLIYCSCRFIYLGLPWHQEVGLGDFKEIHGHKIAPYCGYAY